MTKIARKCMSLLVLSALSTLNSFAAFAFQSDSPFLRSEGASQALDGVPARDSGTQPAPVYTPAEPATQSQSNGLMLFGSASQEQQQEETSIAWDEWRNKVSKMFWRKLNERLAGGDAIMIGSKVIKLGNNPYIRFPIGTTLTYACEITRDHRIQNLRIESSSGNVQWNNMMLNAVWAFNGKKSLSFPSGSQRDTVTVRYRMTYNQQGGFIPGNYNDVERY
ncbi:MAG: hypothetical protein K2Z81_17480 [Cyanobacteria bacterium]|nr:hypothetical protein [Cyanobacteriota bacterium]